MSDIIIFYIPNNRKNDSDAQEKQSRYKNTAVFVLFRLAELSRAVIGVKLVLGSSHRDKGKHHVSENESDSDERALSADEIHRRKERHQDARHEKRIRQDLQIYRRAFGEKAL